MTAGRPQETDKDRAGPKPLRGLSGRLLILTILFVLAAEALIYFPSLGGARAEWLRERANAAQIAALALEAAPDRRVSEDLSADLLQNAQLLALALQRDDGRDLRLGPVRAVDGPLVTVDLATEGAAGRIVHAVQTLTAHPGRYLRVTFPPPDSAPEDALFMEMILPEAPLQRELRVFSARILALSLLISVMTAALVYFSLIALVVRPIGRITHAIEQFRDAPADWTRQIAPEQLHVILDGDALEPLARSAGVAVTVLPRRAPYQEMERDRWAMQAERVSGMLGEAEVVVYTDVDEILVVDPALGRTMPEALGSCRHPVCHARGLEIIHRSDVEPPIDLESGILRQRRFFRSTTYHSKPCIVRRPIRWNRGGHNCDHPGIRFPRGVYAIHLRFYDEQRFLDRCARRRATTEEPDRLKQQPRRRWRQSHEEAEALMRRFRELPLPRRDSLDFWRAELRMRWPPFEKLSRSGLYKRRQWASERLQRLPARFADLF